MTTPKRKSAPPKDKGGRSRLSGKVEKIDSEGGFGFLVDEEGSERFFHVSMLGPGLYLEDLHAGDTVEFKPLMSDKGARAIDVRRLES